MKNPWLDLPSQAPFVAPCDVDVLKDSKDSKPDYELRFDAFPEPYNGDMHKAEVILLVLNPGFDEADITTNFDNPHWVREVRANLEHNTTFPFLYLSPELQETGGYRWWAKKLRPLEVAGVTRDELANGLMSIQFLPYHSKKYKHNRRYLPSQEYQFYLVREAMRLGKTIIIMRAGNIWVEAVPELANYPYLELSSPQNVSISRLNLDNKNGVGTFDKIVDALSVKTV